MVVRSVVDFCCIEFTIIAWLHSKKKRFGEKSEISINYMQSDILVYFVLYAMGQKQQNDVLSFMVACVKTRYLITYLMWFCQRVLFVFRNYRNSDINDNVH